MSREQGVDDLGDDRVLVPYDAGKQRLARFQSLEQVAPDLVPDGSTPERGLRPAAVLQFTKGAWLDHEDGSRNRKTWAGRNILGFNDLVADFQENAGAGERPGLGLMQLGSP